MTENIKAKEFSPKYLMNYPAVELRGIKTFKKNKQGTEAELRGIKPHLRLNIKIAWTGACGFDER